MNSNLKNKQKTKNVIYNQKLTSIKKNSVKKFSLGYKINLYKKKIFNPKNVNEIPISSVSQSTSQYIKYKYLNPNNNTNSRDNTYLSKTNSKMINNNKNNNSTNLSLNC